MIQDDSRASCSDGRLTMEILDSVLARGERHRDRKRSNLLRYRVVSLALCNLPDLLPQLL